MRGTLRAFTVDISNQALMQLLASIGQPFDHLPEDARVIGTRFDAAGNTIRLVIESDRFPPVQEGATVPPLPAAPETAAAMQLRFPGEEFGLTIRQLAAVVDWLARGTHPRPPVVDRIEVDSGGSRDMVVHFHYSGKEPDP